MALALTFLERYHKYGNEFLSRFVRVTGDETWFNFLMLKPKRNQSSGCTHSPNKPKKFKQTSARKLLAAVCWDKKKALMVELMQRGTTIMSEVYCEKLK
jgi:hypothetical protein